MNLRDEIAKAAAQFDQSTEGKWHGHQMADALMPIVERAVRDAAWQGASAHSEKGRVYQADIDAIVRRVMEGGE